MAPENPTFGADAVERALTHHFCVDEGSRSAFVSRFRHMQRVGIAAPKAGRGRVARYSVSQVLSYGLAISLAEIGLTPAAIRMIYDAVWPEVGPALDGVAPLGTMLFVSPALLSKTVRGAAPKTSGVFVIASERIDLAGFDRAIVVNLHELKEGILGALIPPRLP